MTCKFDSRCRLEGLQEKSQDRDEDMASWHKRCDELQTWVEQTVIRLQERSPVSSFGAMKRQQSVTEVRKAMHSMVP